MGKIKRWIPLFIIIVLMLTFYFSGLTKYFSFETLKDYKETLLNLVSDHWFLTPFLFILLYIVITALSLPIGIFLSLLSGFLFPQPFCTIYVVIGATIGASIIFLVAKTAARDFLQKKAGPKLKKMEREFRENGVNYLLFLRLVPLFPFWLVNIAPAFFNISLITYIWTTMVGIAPGSFVYAQAGRGLGAILDSGNTFSIGAVFNWQLRIALIALGIFVLVPVIVKKIRKRIRRKKS